MKKKIFKNSVCSLLAIVLMMGNCINVKAAITQNVVRTYTYDQNKFTGAQTNYRDYTYMTVPVEARLSAETRFSVGNYWNYNTYTMYRTYIDHGVLYK